MPVSEEDTFPAEPMRFELNRRTFVGASVAIGRVVATSSLLAGCSDDEASAASAAEWSSTDAEICWELTAFARLDDGSVHHLAHLR